jgi:prepilin-type N-terminal cleavage/methylation domain-containing protein
MKLVDRRFVAKERGFSLTELMVAMLVTLIVMAAIFTLLQRGQDTFRREPEVADLNQNARGGLRMISADLMRAGFETPPVMAIMWIDGGGITPDELTIVYADENVPTSEPIKCADKPGPCKTIERSSVLNIEPDSFDPPQANPEEAYHDGQVLFAIETSDCDGDGQVGAVPFEVTQPPLLNSAGGVPNLQINHNPGQGEAEINRPGGFNRQVHPDCAVIGLFHVIQYRVNPLPPAPNPMLERRDLALGSDWIPVSSNIENLQVQYAVGMSDIFNDAPTPQPVHGDPNTWITRVKVTVFGRSESRNLEGSSAGVFASDDTYLRKTFSTTMSLRNQTFSVAKETDFANYN